MYVKCIIILDLIVYLTLGQNVVKVTIYKRTKALCICLGQQFGGG